MLNSRTACCGNGAFDARISFGRDVRQPGRLETRTAGSVLTGIRAGEWAGPVSHVRELPMDSPAQRDAKRMLPFCTWSGEFARRDRKSVV